MLVVASLVAAACSTTAATVPTTTTATPETATASGSSNLDLAGILADFVGDQPGGAVALVKHNGTLTVASYGDADDSGTRITRETPFRVGSVSKWFIATMILQLVDEGAVDLDQPLGTYLPDIKVGAGVTVRQLLSHMSGIPNYTSNPAFFVDVTNDFTHTYEPEEILSFVDGSVANEPGAFEYSNTNYILLGMLLTYLDGTSLNESLQRRIAGPLGLTNTVFVGHGVDAPDNLVSFWSEGLNAGLGNVEYESIASGAWAAGALVSTVDDLAGFLTSLFDGDLVSEQALAEMIDTGTSGYGLGLFAARLGDNEPGYAHNGAIPGFSSTMGISPQSGDMIIVLTNNDLLTADQVAPQIFAAW